jgi:hypothetical protein
MLAKYKVVLPIVLLTPHLTFAKVSLDDIRIVTGASLGYSQFSFPEKLDQDVSFPSVKVPIALALEKWQLSANLQTTLSDAQISEEEELGRASRDDLDITLGYQISNNWTVFTGYKSGDTNIQFSPRDAEDEDEDFAITTERYEQKGPFLGFSYSWRFEKAGTLSFSTAYAILDATNDFTANIDDEKDEEEQEEEIEFDDITGRVSGDTKGFSYSLTWTMPVASNLVFQTRFKVNDYKQDIVFNNTEFSDIDESYTSLHVGLAYVF